MQQVPQIEGLQDRSLGTFTLQVKCVPRHRVGHFDLDIFLKDNEGKLSCEPIVMGIYSKGNPTSRIFNWLDIHYLDRFAFDKGDAGVLSDMEELAEGLFGMLGDCVPPGGRENEDGGLKYQTREVCDGKVCNGAFIDWSQKGGCRRNLRTHG